MEVIGHKGGASEARAAVEAPDSLASIAYAKVLDLVSEGEIYGLVNGLNSIFLDETPAANTDGTLNFSSLVVDSRKGTQDQTYIQGYPSVENEIGVGVALTQTFPYTRTFSNVQLSGCRIRISTPRLAEQDSSSGDTHGYRVEYRIDLKTGDGPWLTVINGALDGKTTSTYERSHRIDFPLSASGWTLRLTRVTPDSSSQLISSTTTVVSVTEVIDAKFRYPNSAIIATKFDSSQFQSIPTRAFHLKGMLIRIPTNYDPESRTYAGVWNGLFKVAYSNNPAWVYYDLVLNDRYGLGHLIKSFQIDRYELYRIAQYCDQQVSDGKGGLEPRFTCNMYLQKQADALKVLQDLAALFRGMSYWGASQVIVTSDMPEDPTYTYTNANVIDGNFDRQGTGKKSRYSVALISWNDPDDFYRAKVEYVEDRDTMVLVGHRQTSLTAIGCTSQGQAQRLGRWTLLTNKLETDTITFKVGLDGTLVRPGKIVRIADNKRAGRRIGGRIKSATRTQLTLDGETVVYPGDRFTAILPNGVAQTRVVGSVGSPLTWDNGQITWDNGQVTWDTTSSFVNLSLITVTVPFDDVPLPTSMWAVDSDSLATELFRILSIQEDFTGDSMMFTVSATKHVAGKFANVDTGTRIESPPITIIPPGAQDPVTAVQLSSDYSVDQGNVLTTMAITWAPAANAVAYEVQWKMNNGQWVSAGRTGTTRMEVQGILAGRYLARIQAFNANGLGSVWANSIEYTLQSKNTPPPLVTFLVCEALVMAVKVSWGFPETLDIQTMQRTEIWYGQTNDITQATKQGEYSYPTDSMTMSGLSNGASFFFWARLVDKIGNLGQFFGPVYGITETDALIILEYLKGQITATQLSQGLLEYLASDEDLDAIASQIDQVVVTQNNDRSTFTQQINTAQSTANGASAIAQTAQNTAADINGDLAAMYTIKTQVTAGGRTYIAGIGVGVENSGGVVESQVLVAASRFAVLDPNGGSLILPFVVQGGQVIINSALIGTAVIQQALVGATLQSVALNASGQPLIYMNMQSGLFAVRAAGSDGSTEITGDGMVVYSNGIDAVRVGKIS